MSACKLSLKLLIDRKAKKVIFAEAGKDFVDFLFNLLSLPVGSIIRLLTERAMVGCIGNLYKSIEDLNAAYMQPNQNKDSLLKPSVPQTSITNVPLLLSNNDSSPQARQFFSCSGNHYYVSNDSQSTCPSCFRTMAFRVQFVPSKKRESSSNAEGGFVKGLVTYMVMDDLSVMPLSMIAGIAVLNKFNVSGFDALEEKMVDFGFDEGLKLLQASLQSKAALTEVFLVNDEQKGGKKISRPNAEKKKKRKRD